MKVPGSCRKGMYVPCNQGWEEGEGNLEKWVGAEGSSCCGSGSLHGEGGLAGLVGAARQPVLLPSQHLCISLDGIVPGLNPHPDDILWGRDHVRIVRYSLPLTQRKCLINTG